MASRFRTLSTRRYQVVLQKFPAHRHTPANALQPARYWNQGVPPAPAGGVADFHMKRVTKRRHEGRRARRRSLRLAQAREQTWDDASIGPMIDKPVDTFVRRRPRRACSSSSSRRSLELRLHNAVRHPLLLSMAFIAGPELSMGGRTR